MDGKLELNKYHIKFIQVGKHDGRHDSDGRLEF